MQMNVSRIIKSRRYLVVIQDYQVNLYRWNPEFIEGQYRGKFCFVLEEGHFYLFFL